MVKSSRSWCFKLTDPRTGRLFTNPSYSADEAKADPTGSIRPGQPRPEGQSSWIGYTDAYRASRAVRYAVDRAFAEVIVAHPEWYVGVFPNGYLRRDFLLQLDVVCTDTTKNLKDLLGLPKATPSNSAELVAQHPLRHYIKDQHLSGLAVVHGGSTSSQASSSVATIAKPSGKGKGYSRPSSVPAASSASSSSKAPKPSPQPQAPPKPPPRPQNRGDKRPLSRDEPRGPLSVQMRSGPDSSSSYTRISHADGPSNLKLEQNSTSSTRYRSREEYTGPTDFSAYRGVDHTQIPTRAERLRDEPRGRDQYRPRYQPVSTAKSSSWRPTLRQVEQRGRGTDQPNARADDRSRTPVESDIRERMPSRRKDGCLEF